MQGGDYRSRPADTRYFVRNHQNIVMSICRRYTAGHMFSNH